MPFDDVLKTLQGERVIVDVRRDELGGADIRGFVAGVSDDLVLIAVVGDHIERDGFTILERSDITFLRWGTGQMKAWERVVKTFDQDELVNLPRDLADWQSAITLLKSAGPVSFYRERVDKGTTYIARDFALKGDLIVGTQVTTEGEEDGVFAFKLDDLTRVEFGGSYERGLGRILGLE